MLKASLGSLVNSLAAAFRLKVDRQVPVETRFGLVLDALFSKKNKNRPVKSLMYQSGYLTIKKVSGESNGIDRQKLILGIPNQEVRTAIRAGWFDSIVNVPATEFDALVDVAKRQVSAGDVDGLINETLYRIYAKIPPEWKICSEADVKRHFRLFMEMLGAKVAAEEGSAFGYADAIIETKKFVWIFEFKFNKSAKAAIEQIRKKGYADPYKGDKRPVTLVGINFRTAKRNIDEPVFVISTNSLRSLRSLRLKVGPCSP